MIPKVINYCWFGGKEKPELVKKCINSWKKYCPDYEIKEWNESNYDISSAPLFVRQAYEAKKWGFVPDYIRAEIIYNNGGIYLDTDVEIIKNFDNLLNNYCVFGFEDNENVNLGHGFAAEKGCVILKEIMEQYTDIPFVLEDGSYYMVPSPQINTKIFVNHGLVHNGLTQTLDNKILVYSTDYFCPKSWYTGLTKKTRNTYSIHHFDASWHTPEEKEVFINKYLLIKKYGLKSYESGRTARIVGFKNDVRTIRKNSGLIKSVLYAIKHFFKVYF